MTKVSDLSSVERFAIGVVAEEEHVNKGDEEAGCIPGGARIVCDPLIEDQNDEVTEQAGQEDDLWDESKVDIQRFLKIPVENHNHFVTFATVHTF